MSQEQGMAISLLSHSLEVFRKTVNCSREVKLFQLSKPPSDTAQTLSVDLVRIEKSLRRAHRPRWVSLFPG
jgi:hypothetical protein